MRVKTDKRRRALMEAAAIVFRAHGFERASMQAISAQAGGSKGTLYSYFRSKEELFFAVVEDAFRGRAEAIFDLLTGPGTSRERLTRFACAYVAFRLHDDVVELYRMLIAEAGRSNLGMAMHIRYIAPQWRRVAAVLQAEMEAGRLKAAPAERTATHFRLLIEGELIERRLRGDASIDTELTATEVAEGLEAFLRAYAPVEGAAAPRRAGSPDPSKWSSQRSAAR